MYELTETQSTLQDRARCLADTILRDRAAEIDRTEQYPWHNIETLKEAGFLGMTMVVRAPLTCIAAELTKTRYGDKCPAPSS